MPTVKNVGEPCAGEPHARIDGGREETGQSGHQPRGPGASRLPGWRREETRPVGPARAAQPRRLSPTLLTGSEDGSGKRTGGNADTAP